MKKLWQKIVAVFKTHAWVKWAALAAALIIALTAVLIPVLTSSNNDSSDSSSVNESGSSITSSAPADESNDSNSSGGFVELLGAYEITVLNADGSAAKGVSVQLCIYENGKLGACLMPLAVGINGKVLYTAEKNTYEIHVLDASYKPLELKDHVITEAEYGEYTVTLAE